MKKKNIISRVQTMDAYLQHVLCLNEKEAHHLPRTNDGCITDHSFFIEVFSSIYFVHF